MNSLTTTNSRAFPQKNLVKNAHIIRFGMHQPPAEAPAQGQRRGQFSLRGVIQQVRERLLTSFDLSILFARSPAQVAPELIQAIVSHNDPERARATLRAAPRSHRAAIVNFADTFNGRTPFQLIVMNWEAATVGTLLDLVPITERAAIINTPDDMGNTAFHMAVREVNLDKVQVLLNAVPRNQRAAIVNHRNAQGRTPLQLLVSAAQRGAMDPPPWGPHPDAYIELVDYLLANGARLN